MVKKAYKPGTDVGSGITRAQAVTNALAAGIESLDDVEGFMKSSCAIEMARQQLSACKSQAKPREPAYGGERSKAAGKPSGGNNSDLVDGLEAMRPLVDKLGAEKVKRLADLLG